MLFRSHPRPVLSDQFQLRFGVWLFNVAAFKLFGVSEFAFFARRS